MANQKLVKNFVYSFVLILFAAFCFLGCTNDEIPKTVELSFMVDGEVYEVVNYEKGSATISIPEDPTKDGYDFGGWFWDDDMWHDSFSIDSLTNKKLTKKMSVYAKLNQILIIQNNVVTDVTSYGESLSSITIPNSVTSIGYMAFYDCSRLENITIPNSVTSIGNSAFGNCRGLTSITIPNSITSIGNSAFGGCTGLTSVTIPSSVINIGGTPFLYCTSLTSIVVDENNTVYDSRNNCNAIIKTSTNELIQGCNNTTIPNDVQIIGNSAFAGCTFTSIAIPDSVSNIGNNAFYGCTGLTSIYIPSSVLNLSTNAFRHCSSLSSIVINSDNHYFDSRNNCNAIIITSSNTIIQGCNNTTIPSGVKVIAGFAFEDCTFTNMTIPSGVTTIQGFAFNNCSRLSSVTIPLTVTSLDYYAFNGCDSLQTINYEGTRDQWYGMSSYSVPDGVTIHYNYSA